MSELTSIRPPLELAKLPLSGKDFGGSEKHAYKIRSPFGPACVKIVREFNGSSEEPQDRTLLATNEFAASNIIRSTDAGIYVPKPICYVTDQGVIVGLALEWRDGEHIDKMWQRRPLSAGVVNDLEKHLCSLPNLGITLAIDSFSEGNLMVGKNGNVWFAECSSINANPTSTLIDDYIRFVKQEMISLREEYTR